jgi:hypothetical protein
MILGSQPVEEQVFLGNGLEDLTVQPEKHDDDNQQYQDEKSGLHSLKTAPAYPVYSFIGTRYKKKIAGCQQAHMPNSELFAQQRPIGYPQSSGQI